jgi:hypothetical protein
MDTGRIAAWSVCAAGLNPAPQGGVMHSATVCISTALVFVSGVLLAMAPDASAQNKCNAKGTMGGQTFELANCEVAYYAGSNGVTIWFSNTPITTEEREFFQRSSSADRFKKGRTMVQLGFCPGGSSAAPSPTTATSVEIGFKHATVLDLGTQDQWVLEPAKDKQIKVDKLSGDLKKGGKLAGKITGAIIGHKPPFNWDLEFDLTLPQNAAGAGPGC